MQNMPGSKIHDIFYKQLKGKLSPEITSALPDYDYYSIFAQGHDLLIFNDYWKLWKLNQHIRESLLLQEDHFQEFIYQYLIQAKRNGHLNQEQTFLFIGPGYIAHHILDSYLHPLIIFYAGDHIRDASNETWKHGMIETLLDVYFTQYFEHRQCADYKVYEDFPRTDLLLDPALITVLDDTLFKVYGIQSGGSKFKKGIRQTRHFIHLCKYDPHGYKKIFFAFFDHISKGSAALSYSVDPNDAVPYMNLQHHMWTNPKNKEIGSTQSMLELYDLAMEESASICNSLYQLIIRGDFTRDEVYAIIPDRSSSYGLPCSQ